MRVLALDVSSSCTGWALLEGDKGSIPKIVEMGSVRSTGPISGFEGREYPWDYYHGIRDRAAKIANVFQELDERGQRIDTVVVEETNAGGRAGRYSQKVLEQLHFALWIEMAELGWMDEVLYINTSDWRKVTGQSLTKEDRKLNTTVRKLKKAGDKEGLRALGVRGKIGKKHVAVRFVNLTFGLNLKMKDQDIADAISIGTSFFMGVKTCDGK